MVESEKNPGRPQTETEDVGLKAGRERLALVTTKRSERMTNYSLACSPQVIIREVKFKLFLRVTGVTGYRAHHIFFFLTIFLKPKLPKNLITFFLKIQSLPPPHEYTLPLLS